MSLYRVHNDSSHFVGMRYYKLTGTDEVIDNKANLKDYQSEFCLKYGSPKIKRQCSSAIDELDQLLDKAFLKSFDIPKKERISFMANYLKDNNYNVSEDYIQRFVKRKEANLRLRIDRFRKKAFNNEWNYFVTITYDDSKHDEESFREKLKKCLANLHDRYGYKYMGVFERSKVGRLHFHALMYVPKGEMRGNIILKKDYSTSDKKMRIAHINTFFEERFGRNDFIRISSKQLLKDNTINYLLKYIAKSNDFIFYSRGIPTYLYVDIEEDEVITSFGDMFVKYVLFDDILENHALVQMRC